MRIFVAGATGAILRFLVPRLAGGSYVVMLMTQVRGASNEKARRELGWTPARSSWRGALGAA